MTTFLGQVLHSILVIFHFLFLFSLPLQLKIGYTNYGSVGAVLLGPDDW